jgi:hypothetical protein
MMKRRGRVFSASVGLVALLAIGAGSVAFGAIPDSGGLIHGCYSSNASKQTNGTQLNIVDADVASCNKNQQEVTWNKEGRPGADGVSVTSASLSSGDSNCPTGGSQFTAASNSVTYACNGAKGDKGDKGDTGAAGPSAAYANYGDGFHTLAAGATQTVASVTVPAGSYTISGAVQAIGVDDGQFLQCGFIATAAVNGRFAVLVFDSAEPMLADVTVNSSSNAIFLRCNAQGGEIQAAGQMIATRVGSVTASE